MWEKIKADARHYHQLRFGKNVAWWTWIVLWSSSRGLLVLATHRMDRYVMEKRSRGEGRLRLIPLKIALRLSYYALVLIAKADVIVKSDIGANIYLSNLGNVVLGAVRIGDGTLIHHRVTIGINLTTDATPSLGKNIWIGPDCVMYGNISIGDGATLLPGTVVSKNVAPNTLMCGNPARVLKTNFDNSALRRSLAWNIGPDIANTSLT
jgi:serine acetyltransferase